jgi:hypothetical protein
LRQGCEVSGERDAGGAIQQPALVILRRAIAHLFLAITIVMLVAWCGSRSLALSLFAVTLLAAIATYLHHATDALKLSF